MLSNQQGFYHFLIIKRCFFYSQWQIEPIQLKLFSLKGCCMCSVFGILDIDDAAALRPIALEM